MNQSWLQWPDKVAKLKKRAASVPTKLRRRATWELAKVASLPAQVAWRFSNLLFIEENILYPRYQKSLKEHESKLPNLDAMDSMIVDEFMRTGICVTSVESLAIPITPEFFEAAKKMSATLAELSSFPANKGNHQILATSAQLMRYVELFHWGLDERLLKLVERYLGLPVAYDGLSFVLSIADGSETGARAWHRDREDRRMVKVCVYLNDVDDEGGPFECLQPQINSLLCNPVKDRYKSVFNEELQQLSSASTSDGLTTITEPVGTVVFVDTALYYHRGKPPTALNRTAIFFSYFSRRPWHPFFCQRSPFSRKDFDCLTTGISLHQRACVYWQDTLPWAVKCLPKSRI